MMYRILITLGLFFTLTNSFAQAALNLYEVVPDSAEKKYLKGFIGKDQITNDADFGWYKENLKYAKPNKEYVDIIKPKAYDFQIMIFLGTWCHDTQQILPKYFALLEAAEFPDHRLVLIACDRQKTEPSKIYRSLNVVNVPTLIVLKDGKEVGRIVEFGASGQVDKELAEIVKKM